MKNFPQSIVIHTIKDFYIVSEAEVDIFLELPCFFYDPRNNDILISGSSAFYKPSLYICKISVCILLKSNLKDFEHNLTNMQNECKCVIVWSFFGTVLLWDWNEKWPFTVLWPLLNFQDCTVQYCRCKCDLFSIFSCSGLEG